MFWPGSGICATLNIGMDFPWPTPSGEQPSNGELNLLVDNNLLLDLDDKTLQVGICRCDG